MALDEAVFQHQRLELRGGNDDVKIVDMADHGGDLGQMVAAEIAGDTVLQRLRLSDIDDLAGGVFHDIDARQERQLIRFFPQFRELFHSTHHRSARIQRKGVLTRHTLFCKQRLLTLRTRGR